MAQHSSICKQAIICSLDPTAGRHARVWRPERKQVISVGSQHCRSFRTGHLFGVDSPPDTFSALPYNADIRSELYDILECKWVHQSLVRVLRLPALRRISYFGTVQRLPTYGNPTEETALVARTLRVALSSPRSHTMRLRIDQNLSWQRHPLLHDGRTRSPRGTLVKG
jgi:hypothetical protein